MLITFLTFTFITFLFIFKLDFAYFFTDEILYTLSGQEYFQGIFTRNLQHPLIGKYIVGFITLFTSNDVFFLRLPYALLGVGSTYLVYLILRKYFGSKFGILGALLYVFSPFLYTTTRMVMFESPMHFFWLLFHYYFLDLIEREKSKSVTTTQQILVGIFLGLSIATKIPSILLYIFPFLIYISHYATLEKFIDVKQIIRKLMPIYGISFVVYGLTYLPLLIISGFSTFVEVAKETLKIFVGRNSEGKNHVIDGVVYTKSPWWSYIYFSTQEYFPPHLVLSYISLFFGFIKRNFFNYYWTLFALLNLLFFQLIPLKNSRYIASIELSVVFLTTSLLYFLWNSETFYIFNRKILRFLLSILIGIIFFQRFYYVISQSYTEYNWVFNYFKSETNNFTEYKRMYVFGSIRSLKWYRTFVPDESMFIYRQDYEIMCNEFNNFEYIAFEKEELLMDLDNTLFKYVVRNLNGFERVDIPNFLVFKRIDTFSLRNYCN